MKVKVLVNVDVKDVDGKVVIGDEAFDVEVVKVDVDAKIKDSSDRLNK